MIRAAALVLLLLVGACGLQPMYGGGSSGQVAGGLTTIQVAAIPDRAGWLVRNALVHTPQSATIRVSVRREPGGSAVAEVADDGPGMTREQAAHAFDRFYRADPGRARDRGGSGLGLAIVEAIAHAHGGRATLATAPGAGTTVRLELPAAADPSP